MGHGSNGSPKADGSHGSLVNIRWPMTHQLFLLRSNGAAKDIASFVIRSDLSDRIKNTAIYWDHVGWQPNIFNIFSYRCVMCTTDESMGQIRIHGETRPHTIWWGGDAHINCPSWFHSTIVVNIGLPLERYIAVEYSATFDDTRPI
jgi:hypothetical protein